MIGGRLERVVASALALGGNASAAEGFLHKRVLLTADPRALSCVNGRITFETSLLLLLRTSSSVSVRVPREHGKWLEGVLNALAGHPLSSHAHKETVHASIPNVFDAVLHVGDRPKGYANTTTIHSDGWVARLASDAAPIPMTASKPNSLGAIAVAALGAAEVFKRLVEVRPERGALHARLEFSLWNYSTDKGQATGPALPEKINLSILIAGLGAIGSALAYILKRLPASGLIWLVDPQRYGQENLATSIALTEQGLDVLKVDFVADYLAGAFEVVRQPHTLRKVQAEYVCAKDRPRFLLGALDKISSRHDLQEFWPDLILDGALSESFACQVSRWCYGGASGCLRCQFVEPEVDSVGIAAAGTGLSRHRIGEPDSLITQADVDAAPLGHRERLAESLGRPVCSVVGSAMLEQLSGKRAIRATPSVPFVAVLSAATVVSELIKQDIPQAPRLQDCFHFDVLYGPQGGMTLSNARRAECKCTVASHQIAKYRSARDRPENDWQ